VIILAMPSRDSEPDGHPQKATVGKVEIQMKSMRDALNQFNLDFNRYRRTTRASRRCGQDQADR